MASTAHSSGNEHSGYRMYLVTWFILLVITVVMLAVEYFSAPPWILLGVLLTGMLVKAATIAGNFMHLRYEHKGLVLIITLSLALTAIFLFGYLAADAIHVHDHPAYQPEQAPE